MTDAPTQETAAQPVSSPLTERSQERVVQALDAAAERLELALGYLETGGALDSAQRIRRVREELHLARLVDDRLRSAGPPQ